MASLNGFDANQVEPKRGFTPLPAGKYVAVITDSDEKANSKGTGTFHSLTFEIVEGEFQGRKLFVNLNLNNPNPQAVEIARGDLSAICRAVNVMAPEDTVELHDKPMVLTVGVKKNKDTGELQNVIKAYDRLDGSRVVVTAPAGGGKTSFAPPPTAPISSSPPVNAPWNRKPDAKG